MIENFRITTLRQKRALIQLLEKESISVKELGMLIGSLNSPQTILELRRNGFSGVIKTRYYKRHDQDGKICRVGSYFIPKELKHLVEFFLRRDGAQTVPNKIQRKNPVNNCNNKVKV